MNFPEITKLRIGSEGKLGAVVKQCLYLIATGKWRPGERLPSLRAAEELWDVNHITVQKAYTRLQEMGIVESRPKSGYFVTAQKSLDRLVQHRHELDRFHKKLLDQIREELGLLPLAVLRYLTQSEEQRAREEPEVAFVECTSHQAKIHAMEILNRFRVSVMPMTILQIAGKRARIPAHVHVLLTTGFHFAELQALANPPQLSVHAIPVGFSPSILEDLPAGRGDLVLMETLPEIAERVAVDVTKVLEGAQLNTLLTNNVEAELEKLLVGQPASKHPRAVFLRPRLFGNLSPRWLEHPCVKPLDYQICESAWPLVADALGLPLGIST